MRPPVYSPCSWNWMQGDSISARGSRPSSLIAHRRCISQSTPHTIESKQRVLRGSFRSSSI
jgi:hypothetical protein